MEYWTKIGLTMVMIVVISALSSADNSAGNAGLKENKNLNKNQKTTASTSSPEKTTASASTPKGSSSTNKSEAQLFCPKPIINGIECDGNKKCPKNDSCDDHSLCPCMDGYRSHKDRSFITCEDIQECTEGTHNCGSYTSCNNTNGGYFCTCEKGFHRGNITEFCPTNNKTENGCTDIDECNEDPNICGPNGTCNNTIGSYHCVCMSGFTNITKNCTDIDECNEDSNICGPNGTCNNTIGSYDCVCMGGFRNINKNCTDINECEENAEICGPNGKCENTNGSYTCTCIEGYKNISNNCAVEKKCIGTFKICGLKGNCNTEKGSLTCSCQVGYKAVSLGFEYPQCNVRCKQDKTLPPCNGTELQCNLNKFTESRKPLCSDSEKGEFDVDKLFDDLDDLISNFTIKDQEQRLKMAGILLNAVEEVVQNLAYRFTNRMPLSNKKNFINAVTTSRTSKEKEIPLSNRNSAIRLDTKTALGNAYTSVFGCLEYGNISKLLEGAKLQNKSQNQTVKLVSPVISVFLGIANKSNLSEPIQMQLNFTDEEVKPEKTLCAFWSVEDAAWSTEGCETLEIHQYGVVCSCTHLTSFAVLMALDNIESWPLTLITKIGLSIAIVCLSAAIITFSLCRFLRGTRNTIHIHLCVSLLLGHCIFLIGVEATSNKTVCGIVAGLLHFFYLSAFCWMSLEGLELYLMLVKVFKTQVKTRYLLAMGYGVPTVIIIISAAVYPKGYGTEKHCWLSTKESFIWSFMGPVCVIILLNCGIFVLTVWKLAEKMTAINPEQGKLKRIRSLTVTSIAQLCILGCCWAFGFLMFGKTVLVFAYFFTICNVLQGVQIFFLHCLMHKKIREKYVEVFCALAHFRSPLYSEFSNSTNANTQSRAKVSKESGL